ncbi:MAG: sugar phosphate isomerase/epimerase [Lentisphaeria bacterium]|nr:sugar phosphate isomerase/epimerase [Lentisphaeria bacterium]
MVPVQLNWLGKWHCKTQEYFAMERQISIQLYSVRAQLAADYEGTLRAIAGMGFTNVEPAGFPGYSPEKAVKLFADLGLRAPSCHSALPIGDNRNQVVETALMLGHSMIITGCPPKFRESFKDADAIKATAELYCAAAEVAAVHGLQVGYHNHDWDLQRVGDDYGYRLFLENTPETVLWEADLYWVARAGLSPVEFVKEIGARGRILHFKDGVIHVDDEFVEAETGDGKIMVSNSVPFLPAGTGMVDLRGAADAAVHAEYAVVELDSYAGDMMKAVRQSYNYLVGSGIAKGRK